MTELQPYLSMSPKAVAEKMRRVLASKDTEQDNNHEKADALMVQLLRTLGYSEAMDVYEAMTRWFA